MRHLTAAIVVLGAIFSGMFFYTINFGPAANHGLGIHVTNLIWGLYYGIGFEPAFIWYKIHGPYPTGFVDLFGMIVYPIIASGFLYIAVLRLSKRTSLRKWLLPVLGLSFL